MDNLLDDGNDLGPAPLQNKIRPTDTFEAIAGVLNNITNDRKDANSIINQLQNIATAIEKHSNNDTIQEEPIPRYVITQH